MVNRIEKTDEEWRRELPTDVYDVTRRKGTEPPFAGRYWNHKGAGVYVCSACGTPLFDSARKYDSGSGWPSFSAPVDSGHVATETDASHGMLRTEVTCAACDAHLGHVFDDGPRPAGLRFCINSASLRFVGEGSLDKS